MAPLISVVVGTFGDPEWERLAEQAVFSAWAQTQCPHEVIHIHGATLEEARNQGAERASGEWLVFLDADDELDPGYIRAMSPMATSEKRLLQPATLGVYPDGREDDHPVMIPAKKSIFEGNWMVIGTAIRRDQFLALGGFASLPAWEDWHLWIRAILDGAKPIPVPEAIYRVMVRKNSRNDLPKPDVLPLYRRIRAEFGR